MKDLLFEPSMFRIYYICRFPTSPKPLIQVSDFGQVLRTRLRGIGIFLRLGYGTVQQASCTT